MSRMNTALLQDPGSTELFIENMLYLNTEKYWSNLSWIYQ